MYLSSALTLTEKGFQSHNPLNKMSFSRRSVQLCHLDDNSAIDIPMASYSAVIRCFIEILMDLSVSFLIKKVISQESKSGCTSKKPAKLHQSCGPYLRVAHFESFLNFRAHLLSL